MKCVYSNCRHETEKYAELIRRTADDNPRKEVVAVCDECVRVYLTAPAAKYRSYVTVCANVLGFGLAALILPALVFENVRVAAFIVCPVIAVTLIPLIVVFRRKEIICGNDLIDAEFDKYRAKAALDAIEAEEGVTYSVAD